MGLWVCDQSYEAGSEILIKITIYYKFYMSHYYKVILQYIVSLQCIFTIHFIIFYNIFLSFNTIKKILAKYVHFMHA